MSSSRKPSPARSQGSPVTRSKPCATRSAGSPARSASGRLSNIVDKFRENYRESFAVSPLNKTVTSDNTAIEVPRRRSWWRKVENSREMIEVPENEQPVNPADVFEDFGMVVLSQEKDLTVDLPESSGSESIHSIVVPQRKLFIQKENQPQKEFDAIAITAETTKPNLEDQTLHVGTKKLFSQTVKTTKPVFPSALLNMTNDNTLANKTKELPTEIKAQPRGLFGNRPGNKRKNMFADLVLSESEDEVSDVRPRRFTFNKPSVPSRRSSNASSITTDIELDDWKMLPSSTMVEHQLEAHLGTPGKKPRLSKLSVAKENTNAKTEQDNYVDKDKEQSVQTVNEGNHEESKQHHLDLQLTSPVKRANFSKLSVAKESTIAEVEQKLDAQKTQGEHVVDKDDHNKIEELELEPELTTPCKNASLSKLSVAKACTAAEIEQDLHEDEKMEQSLHAVNNGKLNKSENHQLKAQLTTTVETASHNKLPEKSTIAEAEQKLNVNEETEKSEPAVYNEGHEKIEELQLEAQLATPGKRAILSKILEATESTNTDDRQELNSDDEKKQSEEAVNVENNEEEQNEDVEDEEVKNESQKQDEEENVEEDEQQERLENIEDDEQAVSHEMAEEDNEQEMNLQMSEERDEQEVRQEIAEDDEQKERRDMAKGDVKEVSQKIAEGDEQEVIQEMAEDHEQEMRQEIAEDDEQKVNTEVAEEDDKQRKVAEGDEQEVNQEATEDDDEQELSHEMEEEDGEQEMSQEMTEEDDEQEMVEDDEQEVSQEMEEEDGEQEISQEMAEEDDEQEMAEDDEQEVSQELAEVDGQEVSQEGAEVDSEQEISLEVADENDKQEASEEILEEDHDQEESEEIVEEDNDQEESEEIVDKDNEQEASQEIAEEDEEQNDSQELVGENEQNDSQEMDDEIIEASEEVQDEEQHQTDANITHDTTGRNRKKRETDTPEAILNDQTNELNSFTAKGRNTSIRKTIPKYFAIRQSMESARESIGLSDGTKNSSAEGSGWDSHRTTRKTLRQTFGKDFTPRKSLRTLVMEKSAKRQTMINEANAELKRHQANSTELPDDQDEMDYEDDVVESDHEISRRMRQANLEKYLQNYKKETLEMRQKIAEEMTNPIKLDILNRPNKLTICRAVKASQSAPKLAKIKRLKPLGISLENLPPELVEDMKYKPPKKFKPSNASWITKRLYKFLETKLEPKYDYKARIRAEKLVETIYNFTREIRRLKVSPPPAVIELKRELARLGVVTTHHDFYDFVREYLPYEVRIKVIPDIINKIPVPRDVFGAII